MPDDDRGRFTGLARQAHLLATRQVTSAELVAQALERADASQSTINAFRILRSGHALDEAAAADHRLDAGDSAPLLGVPVAIKDDSDIAGETTPFGCAGKFTPKLADGEAVRRLRRAGAVVIGKTNTPELGQWPWTEGSAFGKTRNPWNLAYSPGGSSGGSAAAVAAGVVAAALGSDGAGSVRIPAAWTGLVGIKPQRGRISTWPDAEAFNGITSYGVLARTVSDAALLLDTVTGNHPGDRHQPPPPSETYLAAADRDPGRLRVALSTQVPFSLVRTELHPEVRAAVMSVAEILSGLGHRVAEDDPSYGLIGLSFLPRSMAGVADWCDRVPDPSLLDPRTRDNGRTGRRMRGSALRLAKAFEAPFARQVGRIFRRHDVVLAPTTASPPLKVGAADGLSNWETDRLMASTCPYAWPWNVLGWPALSVPGGMTGEGLPLGAQLLGPAGSEGLLVSVARQIEREARWEERHAPAR
ncbi:MAG: amidase [Acidimicrobiales bacterium]